MTKKATHFALAGWSENKLLACCGAVIKERDASNRKTASKEDVSCVQRRRVRGYLLEKEREREDQRSLGRDAADKKRKIWDSLTVRRQK